MLSSGYDVERHFQQYFIYIIVVSLTCGGNRSTRIKQPTRRNIGSYKFNHPGITTTTTDYLTLSVYSIEIQDFNHSMQPIWYKTL